MPFYTSLYEVQKAATKANISSVPLHATSFRDNSAYCAFALHHVTV